METVEKIQTTEHDGIVYEIHFTRSGGKVVGLAPVRLTKDLDEDLACMSAEQIHDFCTRQRREDAKNGVRGKLNGKLSAKAIMNAFTNAELTAKALEYLKAKRAGDLANAMKLVLEEQISKPNPNEIHWDCAK